MPRKPGCPSRWRHGRSPVFLTSVDYCAKGARFGPHQFAETIDTHNNRFEDKIAYYAYFNAGFRVVDISNPYILEEVGYMVPGPS